MKDYVTKMEGGVLKNTPASETNKQSDVGLCYGPGGGIINKPEAGSIMGAVVRDPACGYRELNGDIII